MTQEQKKQMDTAYKEQIGKGLITDLNGALGFKLGYEAALKQGQLLPIQNVSVLVCDSCGRPKPYGELLVECECGKGEMWIEQI